MQRLAISQVTTRPLTLEEDLLLCQRLGCALEIAQSKLSSDPGQVREQLARIQQSGVRICSIQPATLTLFPSASAPDPRDPQARLAELAASVDLFSEYWPGLPLLTNTGADPQGNEARVWDACLMHYQTLAEHAQARGMKIALEALGPSLMNRNSILFAFDQAHEMVEQVARDSFGLCLDLYNSWQDPGLSASISAEKLFLVQLADWRRPRSLHDRRPLGQGAIPLPALLSQVAESGYAGDYVLEIFSEAVDDSLWGDKTTLIEAVETSVAFFDTFRRESGQQARA